VLSPEQVDLPDFRTRLHVVEAIQIEELPFKRDKPDLYLYRGFLFETDKDVKEGDWLVIDRSGVTYMEDADFNEKYEPNTKDNWNEAGVKSPKNFAWAITVLRSGMRVKRSNSDIVVYPVNSPDGLEFMCGSGEDLVQWVPSQDDMNHEEWQVVLENINDNRI